MAYIGQSIKNGTFTDLGFTGTFNSSTTDFNLGTQVGSAAQLLVSKNGVIQRPGTDYTLATGGTQISFTTAPASGDSIFIVEISGAVGGPMNRDINGDELILDVDGDTSITADTDDQIDFKTGGSDRVTINSSGNVGIATTSPSFPLHVSGKIYGSGVVASAGNSFELSDNNVAIKRATDSMTLNTGGSARVTIDENGIVTIPNQPSFQATTGSTQANLTNGTKLLFGTERWDKNADYDTSNSVFTCPVAGIYNFVALLRIEDFNNDATYIQVELKGANDGQALIYSGNNQSGDPTYLPFAISYIVECDANDQIYLQWNQSGGTTSSDLHDQSYFSGYLID